MKRKSITDKAGRDFAASGTPKSQIAGVAVEDEPRLPQYYRLPITTISRLKRLSTERQMLRREPWRLQDVVNEALKYWLDAQEKKQTS